MIFLSLLLSAPSLLANDLCARSNNDIRSYLRYSSSRIAFENAGGIMDGGVCWWHNRLQRASSYLVIFDPEKSPPSRPEIDYILSSLRSLKQVVTIPGYRDFYSFTKDHQIQIQAMLEDWQKRDGFLNFEWIRGISGKSSLPPSQMRKRMDEIYTLFKKSPVPVWIMAQIKGVTSHSFLLLEMEQTDQGYEMAVIDSNHPSETIRLSYLTGDSFLKNDLYTFVPYVGFQNDFRLILRALSQTCQEPLIEPRIEDGDLEPGSSFEFI